MMNSEEKQKETISLMKSRDIIDKNFHSVQKEARSLTGLNTQLFTPI